MIRKTSILTLCALALIATCGCGSDSPEKAYNKLSAEAKKGNWGAVYDALTTKSKKQIDMSMGMLSKMSAAFSEDKNTDTAEAKSGREQFVDMIESTGSGSSPLVNGELISSKVDGDKATLTIKQNGKETKVGMVKEDGKWKFNMMP